MVDKADGIAICAQVRLVHRDPSPIAVILPIDPIQSQAFLGLLTIGPNGKEAILWLWTFVATRPMELKFCAQVRLVRRDPSPIAMILPINFIQSQAFLGPLTIDSIEKWPSFGSGLFVAPVKADGIFKYGKVQVPVVGRGLFPVAAIHWFNPLIPPQSVDVDFWISLDSMEKEQCPALDFCWSRIGTAPKLCCQSRYHTNDPID